MQKQYKGGRTTFRVGSLLSFLIRCPFVGSTLRRRVPLVLRCDFNFVLELDVFNLLTSRLQLLLDSPDSFTANERETLSITIL